MGYLKWACAFYVGGDLNCFTAIASNLAGQMKQHKRRMQAHQFKISNSVDGELQGHF